MSRRRPPQPAEPGSEAPPALPESVYFRDVMAAIRDAIFVTEVATRQLSYVNPAFERLFATTLAESQRDPAFWQDRVHPDDVEYLKLGLVRLQSGVPTRPFRVRQEGAGPKWIRLRQFAHLDRDGKPLRVVGQLEDITDEREQEEAARLANESVRRIIEVLPVGILAYRKDRTVFANRIASEQLGVPIPELLGKPIAEIIDAAFREDERESGRRRAQEAKSGRDLPPIERHLTSRTGQTLVVELQTLTAELDGLPAQITVVRDLTEQRRLEAQVAQAERMATVGRISAGVAHELNNPLSYVLGNLEVAREELPLLLAECQVLHAKLQQDAELAPRLAGLSERLQRLVGVVRDATDGADRVRGIMRDLKSFSRPDADDRRERVDVLRPLDAAIRMAWREIQPRAWLVQDRQPVPPVLGLEGRLCQVFLNLLVNAAEALPDGERHTHEVRVATRTGPSGEAIVRIADTGAGIPPQHLKHLFEPFFTTKGPGRGTGLGLSICHDIVRAHGGEIRVTSRPGQGTEFEVVLPPFLAREAPDLPRPIAATRRGRVLIVDDEPHVAATLRQLLARDHDVTVLERGREAVDAIADGARFDVIFCDLMMPDLSGMDVHAALMVAARDQCDRIVFMTGGAYTPVAREFLGHVPNRHLEKPFVLRQVREAVSELLR